MKYQKPQITSVAMVQGVFPVAVAAAASKAAAAVAGIVMSEAFAAGAAVGATAAMMKSTGGRDNFAMGKFPALDV